MFSRNWRYYLALGWLTPFVVLVGFATALVISGGDLLYCKQPDARGSNPSTEPEKIAVPKAANDKVHCRDQSAQRDNECQGWRQAEAAEDQACIARRQFYAGMFLGLLGLLGLGGTVIFTAQAADGAIQAANAARASASTADNTLKEMQKNARHELRAYLSVVVGGALYQVKDRGVKFEASPIIRNTGQTPARKVRHWIRTDIIPTAALDTFDFPAPDSPVKKSDSSIGSQHHVVMPMMLDRFVEDAEVAKIKAGDGQVLCTWGVVTYEDIFGNEWTTEFGQVITWQPNDDVWGTYTTRHNNCT